MSRPMPADGTSRYSTGRPGRENAPAVAVLAGDADQAGQHGRHRGRDREPAAPSAAHLSRPNFIDLPSYLLYAAPGSGTDSARARSVNHISS